MEVERTLKDATTGIIGIFLKGRFIIKMSDYVAHKDDFNLDFKEVLIAPDEYWHKLEKELNEGPSR